MNSNDNRSNVRSPRNGSLSVSAIAAVRGATGDTVLGNDNAARASTRDTTSLAARPEIVRVVERTLRLHRVAPQDLPDAVADVQTAAIATARTRAMPGTLADWKALTRTIASRWVVDRLRRTKRRSKYDAGLCEDPDAYLSPILPWEGRDPVDTKRCLAVLKDLFDSGQMPERGEDILEGEMDGVSHKELAAELGLSPSIIKGRLFRMRAKFRAKLAMLGMLTILLLLFAALSPVGDVAAPSPQTAPPEQVQPACADPAWDGGTPSCAENRLPSPNQIVP